MATMLNGFDENLEKFPFEFNSVFDPCNIVHFWV